MAKSLLERFWSKVEKRGQNECWPWLGAKDQRGYGQFFLDGKLVRATRVSWSIRYDTPFPAELDACHSCDNPNCVNPGHIWPGTPSQNAFDSVYKGRMTANRRPRPKPPEKTTCANGHPYSTENTYRRPDGTKSSKICRHQSRLAYRRASALLGGENAE